MCFDNRLFYWETNSYKIHQSPALRRIGGKQMAEEIKTEETESEKRRTSR